MSPLLRRRSHLDGIRAGEPPACVPLAAAVRESLEWRLLLTARPNVLVEGHESALAATILALKSRLRHPISSWREGTTLCLPVERQGTVILRDVATLPCEQQTMVLHWWRVAGEGMQIISTTSTPLFSLVESGAFIADLYYYLNVVCLDVGLASNTP